MSKFPILACALLLTMPAFAATQIHVVEHAKSDATAHVGARPDNRGDILTFTNDIFDATDKTKMGSDNGFCIRTAIGNAYECLWTTSLAGGQITVEGPFLDAGDSVLAVTGGTGQYAGARGEMALHARDAKGSEYDFKFSLKYTLYCKLTRPHLGFCKDAPDRRPWNHRSRVALSASICSRSISSGSVGTGFASAIFFLSYETGSDLSA
jgi:allene oxide cyclase